MTVYLGLGHTDCQKVKGQGHGRRTTPYLTNQWRQFHPILVTDVRIWIRRYAD